MNVGRQILSYRIDEKLEAILRSQVAALADKVSHGASSRYEPEIELLVSLLYSYFTFAKGQSPGMRAMQIGFPGENTDHERYQYRWYMLLWLRWVFQRVTKVSNTEGWLNYRSHDIERQNRMRFFGETLLKIKRTMKFLQILNKLYFLLYGKFPSVFHRISNHELVASELPEHSNSFIKHAQIFLKDKQVMSDVILGVFSSLTQAIAWRDVINAVRGATGYANSDS